MTGTPGQPDRPDASGPADERRAPVGRRTVPRWVVGTLAGLLVAAVLTLGAGRAVEALRGGDVDTPAPPQSTPAVGGTPSAPATTSEPPAAFGPVPDLCAAADFSPVFNILAAEGIQNDSETDDPSLYQRSCAFQLVGDASSGAFTVDLSVYRHPQRAADWYEDIVEAYAAGSEVVEADDGWDDSALVVRPGPDNEGDVRLVARDGGLVVDLWILVIGDAADADAQRTALADIADNVRDRLRSTADSRSDPAADR